MKMTIYCGKEKPLTAVGKNQCDMLDFAFKYPEWHSYANDKPTLNALKALVSKGCIVTNDFNQFKINL
jgi:hypothetical protein